MEDSDIYKIINQLLEEDIEIYNLKIKLLDIVKSSKNGNEDLAELGWRDVWFYLQRYGFIETINEKSVLTKEWDKLVYLGSIEKYYESLDIIQQDILKKQERDREIKEESLIFNKKSTWISLLSLVVAAIALVYSVYSNNSKQIDELNKELDSLKYELYQQKQLQLKLDGEYVKHIDELYESINNLKKNK